MNIFAVIGSLAALTLSAARQEPTVKTVSLPLNNGRLLRFDLAGAELPVSGEHAEIPAADVFAASFALLEKAELTGDVELTRTFKIAGTERDGVYANGQTDASRPRFDPMTGQPISYPDETPRFDPMTGQPLPQVAPANQPVYSKLAYYVTITVVTQGTN